MLALLTALLLTDLAAAPAIDRLGSPSFRVRERAHAGLRSVAPLAVRPLERGLRHPYPEVRGRCRQLLAPLDWFRVLTPERVWRIAGQILPAKWPLGRGSPWIEPNVTVEYNHYLNLGKQAGMPDYGDDWTRWRWATRRLVADWLLERRPLASVRRLVEALATAEREWCRGNALAVP